MSGEATRDDESRDMKILNGLGVSPGIAIGRAVSLETHSVEIYRLPLAGDAVEEEIERFHRATAEAQKEILRLHEKVRRHLGDELGAVFEAHSLFLDDPLFLTRIERYIREEKVNADWAVYKVAEEMGERFASIEDDYLRERREDLRDVALQLLRSLQGVSHHELSELEGDVVIVADELTPSYALRLGREKVRGFAIGAGSRTSHTTIIARSLNIPAVVGLEEARRLVTEDDDLILDGTNGTLILRPTPEVLEDYRSRQRALAEREQELLDTCERVTTTADGVEVTLMANIDLPEEIETADLCGASGVGLYRSEFLYIERSPTMPSEADHLAIYRRLAEAAAPHPAIVRTYDLGGRKLAQELLHFREENPVLGVRGIRLSRSLPEMFKVQLRALYQAGLYGDIWVMIPMVTCLEEVLDFKAFCEEVRRELAAEGVDHRPDLKLGIMIEVPAAAMIADHLAREVDFFAIGTNDLIQYSMAADRNNEHVADLYQPLHPGLLAMIRRVIQAADRAGVAVSVCGEMAAVPRYAALLLGLGLRRLSMSPRSLPAIKALLRGISTCSMEEVAERCLAYGTAVSVEEELAAALDDPALVKAVRGAGRRVPPAAGLSSEAAVSAASRAPAAAPIRQAPMRAKGFRR